MKMEKRARRRNDDEKSKIVARRRLRQMGMPKEQIDGRQVGILAHTPALCSCVSCANHRKTEKKNRGMTKQEILAENELKEAMRLADHD